MLFLLMQLTLITGTGCAGVAAGYTIGAYVRKRLEERK